MTQNIESSPTANLNRSIPLAFAADRKKRDLHEEAMHTQSTEKRPLYAVAAEEWDPIKKEWGLIIRYNHSTDAYQAKNTYILSRGATMLYRIIGIAPAIGYKVNDDHGIVLSV